MGKQSRRPGMSGGEAWRGLDQSLPSLAGAEILSQGHPTGGTIARAAGSAGFSYHSVNI
jgi:hypothetical protein